MLQCGEHFPNLHGCILYSILEKNIVQRHLRFFFAAVLVANLCGTTTYAQTPAIAPSSANPTESKLGSNPIADAIRKEVVESVLAFNKRDAKAVAAFWTKDGEYVDESGQTFVGREAIEGHFAEIFASHPEFQLQLMSDSIRLLSDSVAIEDGQSVVEHTQNAAAEVSKYTAVHVKVDGKWLLASVRDTWVDTSSPSDVLADLEWLIGDWTAEENGARTESKCRWIVNNKFVERSYSTTQVDGTVTTGLQIIGWNSQANHVQSWNFAGDGGHAIGVWSATEGGWLAKVTGTTGANVSTTAVNVLRRLDDNAYVWQSMDRTVGEIRLPDTEEVIIRRKPSRK
jgi:uncharacterized protein (TIGR02246 family)